MEDIKIIDNYIDEREFRNYVNLLFHKNGYVRIRIDDARISDEDILNDNDMLVTRNGVKYTVQTYLNTKIDKEKIKETLNDMKHEKVSNAIVVTNKKISNEEKEEFLKENIIVFDRNDLMQAVGYKGV